jgi:hypothetical protein
MKYLFLGLFFVFACSLQKQKYESKPVLMDSLWKNTSTKEDIIKKLGNEYKDLGYAVVYPSKWKGSISSVHWLKDNVLSEQIIYLDEKSFEQMKLDISCNWEENETLEGHGHTVYSIKHGKCIENNIDYNYKPGSAHYEVRWKK